MGASLIICLLTSQSDQRGTNVSRGRGESSKANHPLELHDTFDDNPKRSRRYTAGLQGVNSKNNFQFRGYLRFFLKKFLFIAGVEFSFIGRLGLSVICVKRGTISCSVACQGHPPER